ncbi:MAG TPA: hypothetical protein VIP77_18740 [Jiangellaceae bacterium]
MSTKVFFNLPVADLAASTAFFTTIGFSFDPTLTDENVGCLVIGDDVYALLVGAEFFTSHTGRQVADTSAANEVTIAVQVDDRERLVDDIVDKALAAGAEAAGSEVPDDFMHSRSFRDLDGHFWSVLHIDASAVPSQDVAEPAGVAG